MMARIHNLGFPRIGANRELKFALESYWKGGSSFNGLEKEARGLRQIHWQHQSHLELVPVGDFSLYDHVLDMSFTLGNIPQRVSKLQGTEIDAYFRFARGRAPVDTADDVVNAGEMTKWFDTNYHYIVPEFSANTEFRLDNSRLLSQVAEAQRLGVNPKPVIVGPLTYLWVGKSKDNTIKLELLEQLMPVYRQLLEELKAAGVQWVQIDEPILVTELEQEWHQQFKRVYQVLAGAGINLLLTTYFGQLKENLELVRELPVQGIHLDAVRARDEVQAVIDSLGNEQVLSLGVIDGRNIWKSDLTGLLGWLLPIHEKLKDRLWLAPSCSLLHVPVDLASEKSMDPEIRNWLAFARQKLEELQVLGQALNKGEKTVALALADNRQAIQSRRDSRRVHKPDVKKAVAAITPEMGQRSSPYPQRAEIHRYVLALPPLPTTTIGSFPQTTEIRTARSSFRSGKLSKDKYTDFIKAEIRQCVDKQELLGIDVMVHGEAERNDMVEYFGELLDGFIFTQNGWVQSYGSRCVKPPIIFGDITRPEPMTVAWISYAKSLTSKWMKGMLTGPVTILNWSFVRDDQPRSDTCFQLALAIRQEVLDLEAADIKIIQIDEAALREGLPLRKTDWQAYLDWTVSAFRVAANGVQDRTQIHTHMCYSEFNDIIQAISDMDADVITIETSRSDMELLDVFDDFRYPNDIGPGVYDIHSPNIPSVDNIVALMRKAMQRIPLERLWINPDCGLKTRSWKEVSPALENMVRAAAILRSEIA